MERSVFSDYNVFARMLYDTGKINEIEFNGETIDNLFIDGVMQWDASLPPGGKFVDATAGITFLIEDES